MFGNHQIKCKYVFFWFSGKTDKQVLNLALYAQPDDELGIVIIVLTKYTVNFKCASQ